MRPTSRAHRPPALTTCSACTLPWSVITSQVPSARGCRSVTRVWRTISAPPICADLAYAWVTP